MYYNMFQPIFVFLLGFLILLHFFWFTMFIRMGYVLIRRGEAHDLSEHKNGEVQSTMVGQGIASNDAMNDSAHNLHNDSPSNINKKTN